jgi:diadenylate cyclase
MDPADLPMWADWLRFAKEFLQSAIQIGLLSMLIYAALVHLRGTRALGVLAGLMIVMVLGWLLSVALGLEVIGWLLSKVPTLMAFALIIIFQPELRRAFAEIGANPQRLLNPEFEQGDTIDAIMDAAYHLGRRKIGALIAVEREIGMRSIANTGVPLDARLTAELLITIFDGKGPLHDGGVIVKDGMVSAAACVFPLTQQGRLDRNLGTRHRAGVGLSEETDAVVIIVSEERGTVSLACGGTLVEAAEPERLRRHLVNYLIKQKKGRAVA